jgi:hypothetical protein
MKIPRLHPEKSFLEVKNTLDFDDEEIEKIMTGNGICSTVKLTIFHSNFFLKRTSLEQKKVMCFTFFVPTSSFPSQTKCIQ